MNRKRDRDASQPVMVDRIGGMCLSSNGRSALLKLHRPGPVETTLEIPVRELPKLIGLAAMARCEHEKKNASNENIVFDASGFEVGMSAETGEIVLSLTFGEQATIRFRLSDEMSNALIKLLSQSRTQMLLAGSGLN